MKNTATIGVLTFTSLNPDQALVLSGIVSEVKNAELNLFCFCGNGSDFFEDLENNGDIDILLFISSMAEMETDSGMLKKISSTGKPLISIGSDIPDLPGLVLNNKKAMENLVEHLIGKHGKKKIAYIRKESDRKNGIEDSRFEGYLRALENHGIDFDTKLVYSGVCSEKSSREKDRLLTAMRRGNIDALAGSEDRTTREIIEAFNRKITGVSDNLIIAGFGHTEKISRGIHPVTITGQPLFEYGRSAVRKAVRVLTGKDENRIEEIETRILRCDYCTRNSEKTQGASLSAGSETLEQHTHAEYLKSYELAKKFLKVESRLAGCFETENLKSILKKYLPETGIKKSYLYTSIKPGGKSLLLMDLNPKSKHEDKYFPYTTLIPPKSCLSENYSFAVFPLIQGANGKSRILLDMTDFNYDFYKSLALAVGGSLRGIELSETAKTSALKLERKVEEYTTELKKANKLLKEQSLSDELTALRNRRFLTEVILPEAKNLKASFAAKRRRGNDNSKTKNSRFGVFMIDLDLFKEVNDSYGHISGDMVLKQTAEIFMDCIRNNDFAVRLGGEEFLLVLRNFDSSYLSEKAEKIREKIENHHFEIGNGRPPIGRTCSIGCTIFPSSETSSDEIDFMTSIALADEALYYAKWQGRNRAVTVEFSPEVLNDKKGIEKIFESFEWGIEQNKVRLLNATEMKSRDTG